MTVNSRQMMAVSVLRAPLLPAMAPYRTASLEPEPEISVIWVWDGGLG